MKIIAYDNFKPGVTMEDVKPYLPEEDIRCLLRSSWISRERPQTDATRLAPP